jgi:UDP-N-acetylglucosamine acyltransferase
MSVKIHPTAIIEDGAKFGENVVIGPYCMIGPNVKIGNNTVLKSHVVVEGYTTIGSGNEFHQFSSIGVPPQDKSYKNEPTETIIGDNNLFREGVTIHRATTKQDHKTIVGSNGYFMANVHIAHDCCIGNNITLANGTMCAGHVIVDDFVQMGGACGVTPFCHIGQGSFIGAASAIDKDRIRLKGVNIIGMKRRGHSKDKISEYVDFFRMMESSALSPKAFIETEEFMEEYTDNEIVQEVVAFIRKSKIGLAPFMS